MPRLLGVACAGHGPMRGDTRGVARPWAVRPLAANARSTGRSGRQNAATRRNMRREERVTVQGPVKKPRPDGISHRGGLLRARGSACSLPDLPADPCPALRGSEVKTDVVSFPRLRSPVVGVPGLCWMWQGVPFAHQRRPVVGVLGLCRLLRGSFDGVCCPHTSVHRPSIACLAVFPCA